MTGKGSSVEEYRSPVLHKDTLINILNNVPNRTGSGVSYTFISVVQLLSFLIVSYLLFLGWSHLNRAIDYFLVFFFIWLIFLFPGRFYSMSSRTVRNTFRFYPDLSRSIKTLEDDSRKLIRFLPILQIGHQKIFLTRYQSKKQNKTSKGQSAVLEGIALFNEKGKVVDDHELFQKAYLTWQLASNGEYSIQWNKSNQRSHISRVLKKLLPQSIAALNRNKKFFITLGIEPLYQQVMKDLPRLSQVIAESTLVWDCEDRWTRILGYSFGLTFSYADAAEYKKMCDAYTEYIISNYGKLLGQMRDNMVRLLFHTAQSSNRGEKKITAALIIIKNIVEATLSQVEQYKVVGMPSVIEWNNYDQMLKQAGAKGLISL